MMENNEEEKLAEMEAAIKELPEKENYTMLVLLCFARTLAKNGNETME